MDNLVERMAYTFRRPAVTATVGYLFGSMAAAFAGLGGIMLATLCVVYVYALYRHETESEREFEALLAALDAEMQEAQAEALKAEINSAQERKDVR